MSLQDRLQKYMTDLDREVSNPSRESSDTDCDRVSYRNILLSFNSSKNPGFQKFSLLSVLDSFTFSSFSLIMVDKSFPISLDSFSLVPNILQ